MDAARKKLIALVSVGLTATWAVTAPAPPYRVRHKPVQQLKAGRYRMTFGSGSYRVTLHADGKFVYRTEGMPWSGWWRWDCDTRQLTVCEYSGEGSNWFWHGPLDGKLRGVVHRYQEEDSHRYDVTFTPDEETPAERELKLLLSP